MRVRSARLPDRLPFRLWIVCAAVLGLAASAFAQTSAPAAGSVTAYADTGRRGDSLTRYLDDCEPGTVHKLKKLGDEISSIEYTLPPCVIVVFYEDSGGDGKQVAIRGSGVMEDTNDHAMKDNASAWAWYPTQ